MKTRVLLFAAVLLLLVPGVAMAQISNVTVKGSSTSFTMASGDTISWMYQVSPAGATADIAIWLDVDGNGAVDPGVDVRWQEFTQTDGETQTQSGPPDMDGQVNGSVFVSVPVGLAPGKYVMVFSQGGSTVSIAGTVTPLGAVAHTVSGTVTVPPGKSAANIFVEIHRNGNKGGQDFWDAITDANGDYAIAMNADTAGNPWYVQVSSNPIPSSYVTPAQQSVNVVGNPTGIDFSIVAAAAQVVGHLRDDSGSPLVGVDVSLVREDTVQAPGDEHLGRSDGNGLFWVGMAADVLVPGKAWQLNANVEDTSLTQHYLAACRQIPSLVASDSIVKDLTIFAVNSQITGTVTVNGAAPGFPMQIIAMNPDTAQAITVCDGSTGQFTIPVSNKILTYNIFVLNLPPNYSGTQVQAQAGNTGVVLAFTVTGVRAEQRGLPGEFSLSQNYPNPFNPTTVIGAQWPVDSRVKLAVYDVLGREVAVLADGRYAAGRYEFTFDATKYASGLYFYHLTAGNYTQTKSMMLVR
jgi:hypothetical protein